MGEHYRHHKKDKHTHFDSSASSASSESSNLSILSETSDSNDLSVSSEISVSSDPSVSSSTCDSCGPCDLCHTIKADPINIEKHGGRLLTVKIKVNNVCYDKKVAVACIIYGKYDKILAFKAFTTILYKENGECGTIERTITFVVPDDDAFDPCELNVRVIANYLYPCE